VSIVSWISALIVIVSTRLFSVTFNLKRFYSSHVDCSVSKFYPHTQLLEMAVFKLLSLFVYFDLFIHVPII